MTEQERFDLAVFRISKARETRAEVDLLLKNALWNTAVNRLYYACFYAVSAVLIKDGLYSKTHSGTKQLFGLHFIFSGVIEKEIGAFYSRVFNMRQKGDYEDFVTYEEEDVLFLLEPADNLITSIEAIIIAHK